MFINVITKISTFYYRLFYKIISLFCKITFVISDSHSAINPAILDRIKNINNSVVIHCGDWSAPEDYYEMKKLCEKLYTVHGNTETYEMEKILPNELDTEINGIKIHVIHELDSYKKYLGLSGGREYIVLHGHTHQPSKKKNKSVYFFNPGSCGPKRFSNVPASYGVIYFFKKYFIFSVHKIWFYYE
ncbi:metallophosphoesterase family protein [Candidatus Dependentiae bacterium]|nr:metallophosphoesterase family protein [Candidatus Dependentiae bacterium]